MAKKGVSSTGRQVLNFLENPDAKEARPDGKTYYVFEESRVRAAHQAMIDTDLREEKPDPSKRNKRNAGKRVGNKTAKRARTSRG